MADILLRGFEMPTDASLWLLIRPDGTVHKLKVGGKYGDPQQGAARPITQPNWISIGERKPSEDRNYIVCCENGAPEICNFDTTMEAFGDWEPIFEEGGWEGADFHRAEGITHWLDFQIPVLETPEILPF